MEVQNRVSRYTEAQEQIIADYFDVLKATRRGGRISQGIMEAEREYWNRFEPETVMEALKIHIRKYPDKREPYTRGILRTLDRERSESAGKPGGNGAAAGGHGAERYAGHYVDGKDGKLPF